MKWINTQEFISILKLFPNQRITVSAYLGHSVTSVHCWEYSTSGKCFIHHIRAASKSYPETEMLRLYCNQYWKVKTFFCVRDSHEKQLAIRMVEELVMLGCLDDIISEYEIDNVRICEHCHHLMDEGWLVDGIRTFCSDECLQSAYPEAKISELRRHSLDTDSWAYWTKWEE